MVYQCKWLHLTFQYRQSQKTGKPLGSLVTKGVLPRLGSALLVLAQVYSAWIDIQGNNSGPVPQIL